MTAMRLITYSISNSSVNNSLLTYYCYMSLL